MKRILPPYHNKGFAIGTILLAVILIAAIVSAIAIASRGSSSQSNIERERLALSTMLKQTVDYKNAYDRVIANGIPRANIITHVAVAGRPTNANSPITSRCTTTSSPTICLYDPAEGVLNPITTTADTFTVDPAQQRYTRDWVAFNIADITGSNAGLSRRLTALVLADIKQSICTKLNAEYHPELSSIPRTDNVHISFRLGSYGANGVNISAADNALFDGAAPGNGICFGSNGIDNSLNPGRETFHFIFFVAGE